MSNDNIEEKECVHSCSICLDDINVDDTVGTLFACRHFFHYNCIVPWIRNQLTCPTCREAVPIFGGIHQCDLEMAKRMWEKRGNEGEDNGGMSPHQVRRAFASANEDFFGGALPPLGRSIVGTEYHEPSIRVRLDGMLIVRMPKLKTVIEQKSMLIHLMHNYLNPSNVSPVIVSFAMQEN